MKISILQQDLLGPLQTVARSVGVRSTLPVLDNILLVSDGSKLKIAATNLEIGVIKVVSAEIIEAGEVTVPAKTLVELISGLKQAKIDLSTEGEILTITAGKFEASINGISSSEFPAIPQGEGKGISFKKEVLLSVSSILFAAATDEGRPTLTGVLTEGSKRGLDFVATDGFRLAHRHLKMDESSESFKNLIPKKTLEEVLRVLSEEAVDEVQILSSKDQNQIIFHIGSTTISSRLIEGNYPSWEKIIPSNIMTRVIIDKESILQAVKLAAIFVRSEGFVVMKVSKDKLVIESQAKELGSQQNEVEAEIIGDELTIAFNAKFLTDALSAVPSSQLLVEFSGPLTPALIKPMGVEGLQYVIMPVKLN